MCGISAIFSSERKPLKELVQKMNDLIVHRGPDDEGSIAFESAAFGHRRLSIIDLSSAGHQPMSTSDKRYWITYNGEVYNYIELKKELGKLGHSFKTETDTEVILAAYLQWGIDCLHHFNGMFAFIIYDTQTQKTFAARDRFGVKPLYYWRAQDGTLAFASEIKQFTCLPGWKAKMNEQRVYDFLNWAVTDHTSETLFSGVFQIRGGEYAIIEKTQLKISNWYLPHIQKTERDFQSCSDAFKELFFDAVSLRMRADVDVGSCLSGGLDSSSIVCVAHQLRKSQAHKTFSATCSEKSLDETHHIQHVITETEIDPYFIEPSQNSLWNLLEKLTWHLDEPAISSSAFAQYHVFQLAHDNHIKVMLDGQGADEHLIGYSTFFPHFLFEKLAQGDFKGYLDEKNAFKAAHGKSYSLPQIIKEIYPKSLQSILRTYFGKTQMNPEWLDTKRLNIQFEHPFSHHRIRNVSDFSELNLFHSNLPMLLRYEDRNSMAHSIESRTPFLDYRLVEFSRSLPSNFHLSEGITKRVLRNSMKGILPEAIRTRTDKIGFATAEEKWMHDQPEVFKSKLEEAIELTNQLIRPSILKRQLDATSWRIIHLGQWMKTFSVTV